MKIHIIHTTFEGAVEWTVFCQSLCLLLFLYIYLFVCIYVCESEDSCEELVLPFYHVGPGVPLSCRVCWQHLYLAEPSHLCLNS